MVGISGGLDSTLALLVTARAFDMLKLPREKILSVTMPCFGTTDRTYKNACFLRKSWEQSLRRSASKRLWQSTSGIWATAWTTMT